MISIHASKTSPLGFWSPMQVRSISQKLVFAASSNSSIRSVELLKCRSSRGSVKYGECRTVSALESCLMVYLKTQQVQLHWQCLVQLIWSPLYYFLNYLNKKLYEINK